MGALYRYVKHFSAEHIGGADAACDHGGSCPIGAGVRPLGTAQSKFHHAVALGGIDDALCFSGDQALVIDDIKKSCFYQLCLHDRGDHLYKRFSGENNRTFRNGIDITRKTEVPEIFQKVFFKDSYASEICDIAFIEMKIPDIFNHLIQSGADGKPVSVRIVPVKHIENDGFIGVFFFKISLHHGQLIQVGQ